MASEELSNLMREVVNIRQLSRVVGKITQDIAVKYDIEPELVCAVIEDYGRAMGSRLAKLIIISEN